MIVPIVSVFLHLLIDIPAPELEGAEKLGFCGFKIFFFYVLLHVIPEYLQLVFHLNSLAGCSLHMN